MSANEIHLFLVALPAWGRTKPLCHLALRLLDCDERIVVTLATAGYMLTKAQDEVAKQLNDGLKENPRIRVISTSALETQNVFEIFGDFIKKYPAAYQTLHEERPITCATTNVTYPSVKAPSAVILDLTMVPSMHATRALTGQSVPVFNWVPGAPSAVMRAWGPESMGGFGDLKARAEAEAQKLGVPANEVGEKILREVSGAVIQLPGLPPMYDHEFNTQQTLAGHSMYPVITAGYESIRSCDGVVTPCSYALDSGPKAGIKEWLAQMGKDVYDFGPLLPANYWSKEPSDNGATDIRSFLDDMLTKYGPKSVTLVSFGSYFWPPVQEYVEEALLGLLEKKAPFILSHASTNAIIPEELSDKIKASGIAIRSSWIPQDYVLRHPATGCFLTHGGQGGITEAIANGIPLICWPIEGDQPVASVHVAHNLHVGVDLVEVRSGNGLKPIHRLDGRKAEGTRDAVGREIRNVIDAFRGAEGAEMRKNAEVLKAELERSWNEGGAARNDLQLFISKLI